MGCEQQPVPGKSKRFASPQNPKQGKERMHKMKSMKKSKNMKLIKVQKMIKIMIKAKILKNMKLKMIQRM